MIYKMEAAEEEVMSESLWRHLPNDILEMVLLFLPLATAMQFKTVCNSWRNLLTSHSYYRRRYQIGSKKPWLFLCTSGKFSCAFDFTLKRWHRIPNPPLYRQNVVSTAGNLVCLGNLVADCRVLSICDPVRKLVKQLPPMNRIQFIHKVSLNLQTDEASGLISYRIMVSGEEDRAVNIARFSNFGRLLTEVYDSRAQCWKLSGQTLPEAKFGLDAGIWLENKFYCIIEMPYGIVVFDQNKGAWEELEAAMPAGCNTNNISSPSLVECDGRLLMVLRNSRESNDIIIQIWELLKKQQREVNGRVKYEWGVVEEMPEHIEAKLMAAPLVLCERLICCGVGERVCIMSQVGPNALAYNLVRKKWEWIAKDPAFPHGRSFHLFAFPVLPITPCEL